MIKDIRQELELTKKTTSPLKAIRHKCLDCTCGNRLEVEACTMEDCPLHAFRFGKNPFRKVSEKQKENGRKLAEKRKKQKEENESN